MTQYFFGHLCPGTGKCGNLRRTFLRYLFCCTVAGDCTKRSGVLKRSVISHSDNLAAPHPAYGCWKTTTLLMCPPLYYGIEYEINPWMSVSRQSDFLLAQEQWRMLYDLLQNRLHMDVSLMEARRGLPDMVFTANAGLVWENKFIVSNYRYSVRRGEARYFEHWFASRNYEIFHLPDQSYFEGEADPRTSNREPCP